jgi:hypothetical protein
MFWSTGHHNRERVVSVVTTDQPGENQARRRVSIHSLGDRVKFAQEPGVSGDYVSNVAQSTRLGAVMGTLVAWLALINGLSYVFVQKFILKNNPDMNRAKMFGTFESTYWDSVVENVPFLQDWYRGLDLQNDLQDQLIGKNKAIERKCTHAFLSSGFSLSNFENYDNFFRADSTMTLAQTGNYKGPADIAEYVGLGLGFATEASPYIAKADLLKEDSMFKRFDEKNNVCEFLQFSMIEATTDPATTAYAAKYNHTIMNRLFYDLEEDYTKRVTVYTPEGYLKFLFGILLNSENTRNFICSIMSGPCSNPVEQCAEKIAQLDIADGPNLHIDGMTVGKQLFSYMCTWFSKFC